MITRKMLAGLAGLAVTAALLTGCTSSGDDKARTEAENATCDSPPKGPDGKPLPLTLGQQNLCKKEKRESDPNAIGYVYLINFGSIVGYYVSKGKISSSGGQYRPEDDIHWTCKEHHGCQPVVVDGPRDDRTFGEHDPGTFFFLADDTKVVTSLDYIHTDRPIPALNVPKLGG